jgi:hypothetical protein
VLYEPPFLVDDSRPPLPADFVGWLAELVAAGLRGDAVELYQAEAVGIPEEVVVELRQAPSRPALEAIAHILVYDAAVVGDLTLPEALIASIKTPTLVIDGENSPPMLRNAVGAVAGALQNGRRCTLVGQTHDINPDATAPVLEDFLAA